MFYVPGEFVYQPAGLSQKVISRFNTLLERKPSQTQPRRKFKSEPKRTKTIDISLSLARTKRCTIQSKVAKRMELPLIEDKRFLLKGCTAQQSPLKKLSLRRLEIQNKLSPPQSKIQTQKGFNETSGKIKLEQFALVPWQYGEQIED